jgi:hypothetical protein
LCENVRAHRAGEGEARQRYMRLIMNPHQI